MENLKSYEFNNTAVTFSTGAELMVNASEMVKSFKNKRLNDFTTSKQTKAFIKVLESKTEIPVLVIKHGGSVHGTWMHKILALKFAAWLSPEFELWVYDRIEEILIESSSFSYQVPKNNHYDQIVDYLTSSTNQCIQLQKQLNDLLIEVKKFSASPDESPIKFIDHSYLNRSLSAKQAKYYFHKSSISVSDIGETLNPPISAIKLNMMLQNYGVQYKDETGVWNLEEEYENMGLAIIDKYPLVNSNGKECGHRSLLKWTKEGCQFIANLYKNELTNAIQD